MIFSFVLLLLLITFLLPAAHTSTITPPKLPLLNNPSSANELNLSSNPSTAQGKLWKPYCTPSEKWNQPGFDKNDCQGVLRYFYHETMTDGGGKSVEFLSPGAKRIKRMRVEKAPRKYTFGTCTLAIIIIEDFPAPETLPGGYKTGPPTDASTYHHLNRVAAELVEECVVEKGEAGWRPTGQYDGIGLFVWSTSSEQDKEIEDEKTRFVTPTLEISEHDSAATS